MDLLLLLLRLVQIFILGGFSRAKFERGGRILRLSRLRPRRLLLLSAPPPPAHGFIAKSSLCGSN